jgi:hypothetical protein
MASTYANAHTAWRVRTDGNELNGGGFDSSVTNAGTDYTDQASPIVSSTTGTCTVGSTTWTDTGATFTSAMIGNVLRISAKTGGDATALDYFVITAFTNSTNIVLDRSPCATANITAATYRIGGAHASLASYATSATVLPTPILATPLLPGNRIYMRGSGSLDPSSADYDYSAGKWVFPSGTRVAGGAGVITLIGYNGRPRIDHCGALITAHWDCKHVSWFRKLNTNTSPVFTGASFNINNTTTDCIIDQNGFDSTEWYGLNGGFMYNEVRNTGGGAAGTAQVIAFQHPSNAVIGNYIHNVRGPAISVQYSAQPCTTFASICYNTIVNNLSDGIQINATAGGAIAYGYAVFNNTINNNGGHGINVSTGNLAFLTCFNNIISNHTGSGKYGINFADTLTTNRRIQRNPFDANCFYGNTTDWSNWAYQTNDIQANPGYVNAASGNYATGAAVRSKGLSGLGGVGGTLGTATNLVNIGAWQGPSLSTSAILPYWNPPMYSRMTGNLQG